MAKAVCQDNQSIDDDLLLGYLFFYNLGEIKISEAELEGIFNNNQLGTNYVKKINQVDAFRRATSKAKASIKVNFNGDTKKAKLEMDEIKCDNDVVVRLLGRKLVDEKNEKLSYQDVGRISFHRNTGNVTFVTDSYYWDEFDYEGVMRETSDRYDEWSRFHTRDTVRNITNAVLQDMYPVNLLPTGLAKFIPKMSKDTLYSLRGVIKDLSLYGTDCLFEVVPVIDTMEQRQLVSQAASREVREELHTFTQELKEIIQSKQALSPRTASAYIGKFKELTNKVGEYESLLDTYMSMLKVQIQQAVNLVESNIEKTESIA